MNSQEPFFCNVPVYRCDPRGMSGTYGQICPGARARLARLLVLVGFISALCEMPASGQEIQLLTLSNSPWRYLTNGVNPGPSWFQPSFNDSSWASGFGLFGFETTPNLYLPDSFRSL